MREIHVSFPLVFPIGHYIGSAIGFLEEDYICFCFIIQFMIVFRFLKSRKPRTIKERSLKSKLLVSVDINKKV